MKKYFVLGKVLEGTTIMTIRRNKFTVTNLDSDLVYTPGIPFSLNVSGECRFVENETSNKAYTNFVVRLTLATICVL